jgi:hypothetical protein
MARKYLRFQRAEHPDGATVVTLGAESRWIEGGGWGSRWLGTTSGHMGWALRCYAGTQVHDAAGELQAHEAGECDRRVWTRCEAMTRREWVRPFRCEMKTKLD